MECGPPIYTLQVDVDPSVDQLILLHYVPADRPILLCLSNKKLVQDTEISHSCDNDENILIGEGLRMLVDQTAPADTFMVSMTLLSQVGVSLPEHSYWLNRSMPYTTNPAFVCCSMCDLRYGPGMHRHHNV